MRYGRGKGILIIFFLILSVLFLILLGTEIFSIHKITILGNQNIEYNEIVKLSGIELGENIFKLDLKRVEENLKSNPYIAVEKIERELPDTVILHINEREPRAVIEYMGVYIVMDTHGYILELRNDLGGISYPIITGMRVTAFLVGQRIRSSDPYQVRILDEVLSPLYTHEVNSMISEINIEDPANIFCISREGILVKIGQATDMDKKILLMKEVLGQLSKEGITNGVLDVTAGNCASYKPQE
ncbi:MAG: cell division protein FtsQ/DivIB [Clostridia bacterium]